ncbi:MAG: hypoxanthine phosphoribosyltransferase [Anaerolineae bacterium]|nr:hypoxanthine phosphoribosyltransferase [Anaerolineae bacterium]
MMEWRQYASKVLIDEPTLQARIAELGVEISRDYAGNDLLLVCVLKGGVMFLTDLMRQIAVPHKIDFMAISSYGTGVRESTGVVRILMDLSADIQGKDVLIVEDIIDTGHTLEYILRLLEARSPASLKVCCLLDKPERREADIQVDYLGFSIPDEFVFGYGLDVDELYREVPVIAVLDPRYYDRVVE